MEDSMFRRLEHKPKNDEERIEETPQIMEEKPVIETEISFDEPEPAPVAETIPEPIETIVEPQRKPERQ